MGHQTLIEKANRGYRIKIEQDDVHLVFRLHDLQMDFELANGPYLYRLIRKVKAGESRLCEGLADVSIDATDDTIRITGTLGGLQLVHDCRLPDGAAYFEERITLHNPEAEQIELIDLSCAWQRRITNDVGALIPDVVADRMIAIPFRHGPTDLVGTDIDFSFERLATGSGRELRINALAPLPWGHGHVRSSRYFSEGWSWTHGNHSLGIFKFNQDAMEFSVLDTRIDQGGTLLCFGGVGLRDGEPAIAMNIQSGVHIGLGLTRYETTPGDFTEAYYAFRRFLDQNGCHFPAGFNPPVHWNELYDNAEYTLSTAGHPPGKRKTRHLTYTKDLMLKEAAKARSYFCEALYLDPGWDTEFGSFLWGEEWLGDRKQFIETVRNQYGLQVSLHCPLATWMSFDQRGVPYWPESAQCMDESGAGVHIHHWRVSAETAAAKEGARLLCLGSRQYLDEAERRLLEHCADGVKFLMFDGNWYNTGCFNPDHGHPIPYSREDHVAANLDLAQRIHAQYPDVLIEMHDMVVGGSVLRFTPVYYKYGLPGSYDINWGFELMWRPMEDILSGRAIALYYYNLGCNVPIYLHVDLRGDNEHALILWWYASTCRHLGIGGSHEDPMIAETHRHAMKRYQKLSRFFKQGEFYGASEEVHFHVLPDESAFIAVVFNLSNASRVITGTLDFEKAGLDRDLWYDAPIVHEGGGFNAERGTFTVARRLAAWSVQVVEVYPLKLD